MNTPPSRPRSAAVIPLRPAPPDRLLTEADLDDAYRFNRELVERLDRDANLARTQFWRHFDDTQIEPWHQPHTGGRANDSAHSSAAALTPGAWARAEHPAGHDEPEPDMWQLERDHTWLYWLYATVFTAAAVASVFWPWGFA